MAEHGQKSISAVAVALVFCLFVNALAVQGASRSGSKTPAATPGAAEAAFTRLKSLAGAWEAKAPKSYGNAVIRLNYRLISDDSVLIETFKIEEQDLEMVTIYHLDGQQLALTHYCAVNNQVRMLAQLDSAAKSAAEVRTIQFAFRDGSNLEHSHKQVMHDLGVVFEDDKHFVQTWHWRDETSPSGEDRAVYRYTRVP